MARYTGPRDKVSRRFGVALFGSTKALEKRPFWVVLQQVKRHTRC